MTHPISASPEDRPELRATVFVDGPNIDMTLGQVLQRRPRPDERPRWDKIRDDLRRLLQAEDCRFYFNGDHFSRQQMPLYRFLRTAGWNPRTPRSEDEEVGDPVDSAIQAEISQLIANPEFLSTGHIVLVSHDGDFAPVLRDARSAGVPVTIVGFGEWMSPALLDVEGAEILDLERHLRAFDQRLDRPFFKDL